MNKSTFYIFLVFILKNILVDSEIIKNDEELINCESSSEDNYSSHPLCNDFGTSPISIHLNLENNLVNNDTECNETNEKCLSLWYEKSFFIKFQSFSDYLKWKKS